MGDAVIYNFCADSLTFAVRALTIWPSSELDSAQSLPAGGLIPAARTNAGRSLIQSDDPKAADPSRSKPSCRPSRGSSGSGGSVEANER